MLKFESSDGVSISVVSLGGSGPRVLFVHATGFCSTVWRPIAEALSNSYECWALDIRSHGASSDQHDGGFSWEHTADDVRGAIDAIEAAHGPRESGWRGVGHSMGGASVLLTQQQFASTFEALWVFEPIVFPPVFRAPGANHGPNPLAEGARRRRSAFASVEAARANYAAKPPMSTFDPRALDGYLERGLEPDPDGEPGAVRLACAPSIEAQIYESGATHRAFDHLGDVSIPVTVLGSDPSIPGPAQLAPMVADALGHATFIERADLGHFGPLEAPDDLAKSIRASFGPRTNAEPTA